MSNVLLALTMYPHREDFIMKRKRKNTEKKNRQSHIEKELHAMNEWWQILDAE